ncbi:MAG: bifunctional diaminohydroxyphosphoribosylaminopyrimidine deaminase/5-amino-6-(5-phosphoribosylamino)uracil reductase RibD [Lewinellaceae bacterium]|nr:bifunctional diaminohydroxyphosphoribosylaminopyrimidine deaminase/5-amino-6-(5-phosphoribosylamino)uracil reductase RibD [Lewinellaceae bacterium]HQU53802.1 bifunctional diaminohydroxyphosphoribosylaminopyrimidine deaminase/5-amino-6-(5-phosphoribosylamino)uracil reductase RibD [Saprospiraceae bacterium]
MEPASDQIAEKMMRRCLDLARQGEGHTSPNPMVGSVLALGDQILTEGFHPRYRHIHAEAMALSKAADLPKEVLAKATLYVSLEPCFHFGFNPPCVNRILDSPVQEIVISCIDPNPQVAGKSIAKLREAGRKVTLGVLQEEGEELINAFRTRMLKHRPYVILKWAESADGFMGQPDKNVRISNDFSQILTHRWRHEIDAFLVGGKTVIVDNPKLNNRLYWGRSPHRVVYSTRERLPLQRALWNTDCPTILFIPKFLKALPEHIHQFELPEDKNRHLEFVFENLMQFPINSLLVEGGPQTLSTFIHQNKWDEARIIRSNTKILAHGLAAPKPEGALRNRFQLGDNEVITLASNLVW